MATQVKRAVRRWALAASVMAAAGVLTGCPPTPPETRPALTTQPAATQARVEEPPPGVGTAPTTTGIFTPIAAEKLEGDAAVHARMSRSEVVALARKTAIVPLAEPPATVPASPVDKAASTLPTSTGPATAPATVPATAPATQAGRGEPPPLAVKYYLQAREKFLSGARTDAMELLRKALQLDPNSFTVLRLMGRVCFVNNQLANGSLYLQRAHRLRPADVEVNYLLGRYFMEQKEWNTAIAYLAAADESPERVALSPQEALASFDLARSMHSGGYYAAASREFDAFLKMVRTPVATYRYDRELSYLIEEQWAIHLSAAEGYAAVKEYSRALPHYEKAARGRPNDQFIRGRMAVAQARGGEARHALESAIELVMLANASDPSVALLQWVYRATGREAAITQDLTARAYGPGATSSAVLALAGVQEKLGNKSEALDALEKYLQREPGDAGVVEKFSRLAKEQGRIDRAFAVVARSLAARPERSDDLRRAFGELTGDRPTGEQVKAMEAAAARLTGAAQARGTYLLGLLAQRMYEPSRAEALLATAVAADPEFWPAREAYVAVALTTDQFAKAGKVIQEAIDSGQGGVKAHTLRIESEALQGRLARALKLAQEGKEQFPDSPEVRQQLANIHRLRGERPAAARELRDTIAKFPKSEEAYQQLINLSLLMRDVDAVLPILGALMREVPSSRTGRVITAELYARGGRKTEALGLLRGVLAEKPDDIDALTALAGMLNEDKKGDEAVKLLESTLRERPSPGVAETLASFYRVLGRPGDALALFERMSREHPESEQWLAARVGELLAQEKKAEAEALLRDGVKRFPRSAPMVNTLCRYLSSEGKAAEAIGIMEDFTRRNGATAERLYLLAHLYNDVGNDDLSTATLEKVLAINPDHTGANNDLGYFWSDRGKNLARAEALIRKAIEQLPNNAAFVDSLGWIYYKQGKFAEAAEQLRRSVSLPGGREPEVIGHLGDALWRQGKKDEALEQWQLALSMLESGSLRMTSDKTKLRDQLRKQVRQAQAKESVEVAPLAPVETGTSASTPEHK